MYIDDCLTNPGCDGTLLHAQEWAREHGFDWLLLGAALKRLGGYCDCEVLMNCVPEDVFTEPDEPNS